MICDKERLKALQTHVSRTYIRSSSFGVHGKHVSIRLGEITRVLPRQSSQSIHSHQMPSLQEVRGGRSVASACQASLPQNAGKCTENISRDRQTPRERHKGQMRLAAYASGKRG